MTLPTRCFTAVILSALTAAWAARSLAVEPPVIPTSYDAYRQWDEWPYQRIGSRAYMRSTYDRRGGNESADASHYLYQEAETFNVTLDVQGAGVLYFARYNHWHGSPWHYEVDGHDNVVRETTTADPSKKVENAVFIPESAFPSPLTFTYATTKGADLMWVPIGFQKSFRMAYSRTFYGTGYYIFKHYMPGATLSQPIESWSLASVPPQDVLELLRRSGTDIAPQADTDEGRKLGIDEQHQAVQVPAGKTTTLATLNGSKMVRALKLSVPKDQAIDFGKARLRITWDDRDAPSVDAPIALFFGSGTLYNRENKEYLVKAFPVSIRFAEERAELACYFPMPFFQSARVELVNDTAEDFKDVQFTLRTQPYRDPPQQVGYFHATYVDHPEPVLGEDNVFLDTDEVEGGGPWSGNFVGTSFIFSDRNVLNTLEGDPRFFFDDSQTPQAYGTGTEEWGGGGDYWGGRTMTLPFAGHPVGMPRKGPKNDPNPESKIESAYRFLLTDLMPFGRRAVIRLEHGGNNHRQEHYQTVTYWYGAPFATLVQTDTLDVGDEASESEHHYESPDATAPEEIVSRFEWGVDHVTVKDEKTGKKKSKEVFPAQTKTGRTTTNSSQFTLKLRKDNWGVLLRRTLDYQYPNQRAQVFVADATDGQPDWQPAGVWYLAGSNTCYFSYPGRSGKEKYPKGPRGEVAPSAPKVETSNRRFRDDEFMLPRDLTRGREAIRVRVEFTPVKTPLLPGRELDELAWSEIEYRAYCYVLPSQ